MGYDATKRNLTTGDIAKLCGVNFRTVIRWIQRGHLKAYQLPGRGDNRILVKDFVEFLRDHNLPIPEELQPPSQKVLIVEDDDKVAKSVERALKRKDFATLIASDGFTAGTLATTFKPAVMVMDPKMAGIGGLEMIKALRGSPDLTGIKVLVVSAGSKGEHDAALAAGADDVLSKPYENRALIAKIARLAGVELKD